jgi:hypothetical protein
VEEVLGQTATQISSNVRQFADYLKSQGKEVCIYTGDNFYIDNLDSTVKNLPLWVAHYNVNKPNAIDYVGFQYTSTGTIDGVSTNVDLNDFSEGILLKRAVVIPIITPVQPRFDGNENVRKLQEILNELKITDENGNKLDEDGKVGKHTRGALQKVAVRRGDKNLLVGWIQEQLHISVDNNYGAYPYHQTYDAIVNYQRSKQLVIDGIAGINTILKLLG